MEKDKSTKPVFFDSGRKRWKKFRGGFFGVILIIASILLLIIAGLTIAPPLKSGRLFHFSHFRNAGKVQQAVVNQKELKSFYDSRKKLTKEASNRAVIKKPTQVLLSSNLLRLGFFVDWDDASLYSLKDNLSRLDVVAGEWMHLEDSSGSLIEDDPAKEQEVVSYIRSNRPEAKIWGLINNYSNNDWQGDLLVKVLSDPVSRQTLIKKISEHALAHSLNGVAIDFENLPPESQATFVLFLGELRQELIKWNLKLAVIVPASNDNFDYPKINEVADYVIVMAYDQHWSTSEVGPISGLSWYEEILGKRTADISSEKMIVALGSYAYDWAEGTRQADGKTFEEAMLIARESEADIVFDDKSLNPYFKYLDDNNKQHQVWLLDAATIFNELASLKDLSVAGVALWRLGSEDPSIWNLLGQPEKNDQQQAQSLNKINFSYQLDYEGQGEILEITSRPKTGQRLIEYSDADKLITDETYQDLPSPYVIQRLGYKPKKLALTFDDGPDSVYTPLILERLRELKAPATFFVIGSQMEKYPEIVKQEVSEGHLIGNHTFTHPDITDISTERLKLEILATERLLEVVTGRLTILFRSPYAEDSEPDNGVQARSLDQISQLGYLSIGMMIDPNDWRQPGVDKIVADTVRQAEAHQGGVILLHDSGGDRSQTVAALEGLVKKLRADGYEFVPLTDLIGQTKDQVMPKINEPTWMVFGNKIGFTTWHWLIVIVSGLSFVGLVLGLARLLFVVGLASWQYLASRKDGRRKDARADLPVAVIIPAYNEEKVIIRTITSLLKADQPRQFEIVVVDDGSIDDTWGELERNYKNHPKVKIFRQQNEGKAAALNYGLEQTKAEILICLDADTIFNKEAIILLASQFTDPRLGAVAGNAKVGNRVNFLTQCQALEYITSQNIDRRALMMLNGITVVPGAIGAWRKKAVLEVGEFGVDTLAEDADLTVRILRAGWKITYEERAIALTEAPETVRSFVKQRYRWMYGTLQAAWKNKDALFRWRYRWLGWFSLPNIFIYQIFFPLISPFIDLAFIFSLLNNLLGSYHHPGSFNFGRFKLDLLAYLIFILADFLAAAIGFFFEPREDKKLLLWIIPQRFYYRQLMYYVAIKSFLSSLRGGEVGWNKLERRGSVKD